MTLDQSFRFRHLVEKYVIDGEVPTGAMVALRPDDPDALAVPGYEEADALHITTKFLGKAVEWTPTAQRKLNAAVERIAAVTPPFDMQVAGDDMFGEENDAYVLRLKSPVATELYREVHRLTPDVELKWPKYEPHLTLAYVEEGEDPPEVELPDTIRITSIRVAFGTRVKDYPLTGVEKYDPTQPRIPEGMPGGGRWLSVSEAIRGLWINVSPGERREAGRIGPLRVTRREKGEDVVEQLNVGEGLRLAGPGGNQHKAADMLVNGTKAARVVGMQSVEPVERDGLPPEEGELEDPLAEAVVRRMTAVLESIFDSMSEGFKRINRQWYEAANYEANRLAVESGDLHPDGASALLASLSPTANWFDNVWSAQQIVAIRKENPTISQDEIDWVKLWYDGINAEAKKKADKKGQPFTPRPYPVGLDDALGKSWQSLPNTFGQGREADANNLRAHMTRALMYNRNGGSPSRDDLTLTEQGIMVPSGTSAKVTIQSNENLGKALGILDSPDNDTISAALGDGAKVRSFYNNIRDPNDPANDVTIDTHAFSAAFGLPYGTSSKEIKLGDPSWTVGGQVPKSLMILAYQRLAAEKGYQPREAQSIIWAAWQAQSEKKVPLHDGRAPESAIITDDDGNQFISKKARVAAMRKLWQKVDKDPELLDAMLSLHLPRYMRGEWP